METLFGMKMIIVYIYIYSGLGKIIGFNSCSYFQCSSQIVVNIHYYWFIWYNQSERCFKIDNGNVGYELKSDI